MKYTIVPIDTFTKDQKVVELCKMLGRGEVPQNAAQATAWHLTDNLSWEKLASMNRVELRTVGYAERFFTPAELELAFRIAAEATNRAKDSGSTTTSPGEATYVTGQGRTGG
jgi:hypothetical protein